MRLKPKVSWRGVGRSSVNILILLAVFWIGVNVGNGRFDPHRPSAVAGQLPTSLNYSDVNQLYKSLKQNYDGKLSETQLEDGLKHGLAAAAKDPYTVYFTAKEAQDFESQVNNHFSGIGAELGLDKDGNLEVIAPIDGLPAAKAGLKPKDIIASIDKASTSGLSVDEAVSKVRGPSGTKVTLQVVRNRAETLSFTITREDIQLPSVKTKTLDGNIGYIQVSTFSKDTTGLAQKAAEQFKAQGVKGIVLDLRNNGGGYLPTAVEVSSLWLPPGKKVLDEKRGGAVVDSNYAVGNAILKDVPTVVLINTGSASASEITAGALHDNKAAYLIGEKTYGKGVVQNLINFADGSQLKVTVASWYRPNGQNINKKGITPDKTVKISDEDAKAGKDRQLEAAQAYLNK
jgi:carboxyl-terminal processing protease